MDELQFYPTPKALAQRAWARFKDKDFSRVLEPHAGNGDLADEMQENRYTRKKPAIDCVEIDLGKHPILREKGYRVVGLDFLAFEGGEVYSHVIMNPPFRTGAAHVLKAWHMLWDGEIVAIINAQTIRNPDSKEAELVQLIAQYGSVEFIEDAFKGPDVERQTAVEVALVHLVKPEQAARDWIGPIIETMREDRFSEAEFKLPQELALPASFVETQVHAFRLAVKTMREAVRMEAVAANYANNIGATMEQMNHRSRGTHPAPASGVRQQIETRYQELKDRAWTSVLRSTHTLSKLSSKIQRQAQAQFEDIKRMEFTESVVYGFLLGLVQSQPDMQIDMYCDVFDQITMYHSENTVFFKGWKSNDEHQTCGKRIKMTRFIIPRMGGYSHSLSWDAERRLADFDKVFALLDGKTKPEISLHDVAKNNFKALSAAERVSSSYFDIRYYRGTGTVHFFPRDKKLIDRLNKVVGTHRQWLPPAGVQVPDAFWLQFNNAEKYDAEFRREVRQAASRDGASSYSRFADPVGEYCAAMSRGEKPGRAAEWVGQAMDTVLDNHGLLQALEWKPAGPFPRLAAA